MHIHIYERRSYFIIKYISEFSKNFYYLNIIGCTDDDNFFISLEFVLI